MAIPKDHLRHIYILHALHAKSSVNNLTKTDIRCATTSAFFCASTEGIDKIHRSGDLVRRLPLASHYLRKTAGITHNWARR